MTFFVYEAMMLTSALQAERHRRHHPSPGPAGRYVWVLATVTASIVALNASTLVEALLRFTLPLAAAGLWWVGITAEREDDPAEVKRLREAERARREAVWAVSLRRLLVAVGVMRPGTQTLSDAERERRIRLMVIAADRLHAAKPDSRRARGALHRLRRLARLASANDIATVRARVTRTTRITELVLPPGDPAPVTVNSGLVHPAGLIGNGRDPLLGSTVPRNGDVPPLPESGVSGGTAPFHPRTPASVAGNGAVAPQRKPRNGVSHGGGRAAAQRVYRDSVRAGRPLSARDVAKLAGCSPTTAWRGIRAFQAASRTSAPNGGGPSADGSEANADALVA